MGQQEPLPLHFRQKIPSGPTYFKLAETLRSLELSTVCEEAKCPNRTDCYARGTLAFQILGDLCTRRCGFCAEKTAPPRAIDWTEPKRVLEAVQNLKLSHVVLTAPARDDLSDGGALLFSKTVLLLKENMKNLTVEILVSDLEGKLKSLKRVLEAKPHVFNHNIETVSRLTPKVRSKATYERSLNILEYASQYQDHTKTKSGLMVGLGETLEEIEEAMKDLRARKVQYLTVGQYLQPTFKHLPIAKFYSLKEFARIKRIAEEIGFEKVACGPLVRSSFHADEMIIGTAKV